MNIKLSGNNNNNIDYQVLDLMSEEAFCYSDTLPSIDWIIGGDIIYDSILTESLCRVAFLSSFSLVVKVYTISSSLLLYHWR